MSRTQSSGAASPCRHDSIRLDGLLDNVCMRCGADGYWHDGHRHDVTHASGKILFALEHGTTMPVQPGMKCLDHPHRAATTMLHDEDDKTVWMPFCDECAENAE